MVLVSGVCRKFSGSYKMNNWETLNFLIQISEIVAKGCGCTQGYFNRNFRINYNLQIKFLINFTYCASGPVGILQMLSWDEKLHLIFFLVTRAVDCILIQKQMLQLTARDNLNVIKNVCCTLGCPKASLKPILITLTPGCVSGLFFWPPRILLLQRFYHKKDFQKRNFYVFALLLFSDVTKNYPTNRIVAFGRLCQNKCWRETYAFMFDAWNIVACVCVGLNQFYHLSLNIFKVVPENYSCCSSPCMQTCLSEISWSSKKVVKCCTTGT